MNIHRSPRSFVIRLTLSGVAALVALGAVPTPASPGDPLIAGFKSTYAASVSDAVELVTGKNGTMRHDMKLMTGSNLVGRAVTALATVYARSKSPRTAVGHYATVARNVPVECGGVTVSPGDIIVADEDGVVVVPQQRAAEVLKQAQAIDDRERAMYPFIRQFKSLQAAIARFNRI